ncbi:MAG: Chromosome partition protein Smc [Chlamydiae bacterium]|nr:Chromosome partition protein Smc [Chlamydiota bacterium]
MSSALDPLIERLPGSPHERLRPDLYLWPVGNTLGAIGCATTGVILGVKNGFKELPISFFAAAGIFGLNAAKGWYDVYREKVRIHTQTERTGPYLIALEAVAGSLEKRTRINDGDDLVFADARASSFWTRIKTALPGLFVPPKPSGPTERDIQDRIETAVDRALKSIIVQLTTHLTGKKFTGTNHEVVTAMLSEVIAEAKGPKLRGEDVQLADANERLSAAQEKLAEQESELNKAKIQVGSLGSQLTAEQEKYGSLQAEFLAAQGKVDELTELLSSNETAYKEENAHIQRELEEANEKVLDLESKLSEQNTSSGNNIARLEDELSAEKAKVSSLEAQLSEQKSTSSESVSSLEAALRAERERVSSLEAQLSEQKSTSSESVGSLEAALRAEKEKVSALEAQKEENRATLERLTQELTQARSALETANVEHAAAIAAKEKTHKKALSIAKKAEKAAKSDLKKVQQTLAEVEGWSSELCTDMQRAISRLTDPDESTASIETFNLPASNHPLYPLVAKVNILIGHANSASFETDASVDLDSSFDGGGSPRGIRVSFGTPTSPGSKALKQATAFFSVDSEDDL